MAEARGGRVGEPANVEDALAELYPYNLCVVAAEHSASELSVVEERLGPVVPNWQPHVEPALERVELWLDVLDEAALERIADDSALVLIKPLVRKRGV